MKQILDYAPLIIFVAAYFPTNLAVATACMMAAYLLQLILLRMIYGKIENAQAITAAVVWLMGGLTLIFDNPYFVFWQPTILNWGGTLFLLGSLLYADDYVLKKALGRWLQLPAHAWRNLSLGWALGFFIGGSANLWVAYHYSEAFWMQYKLVGGPIFTFTYFSITFAYLYLGGYLFSKQKKAEPES